MYQKLSEISGLGQVALCGHCEDIHEEDANRYSLLFENGRPQFNPW